MVLAAHAASAVLASRAGEQLQSALSTPNRIGQAKGIIMERCNIDDVRAFATLRQLSQDTNTELIEVARGSSTPAAPEHAVSPGGVGASCGA